MRDSGVPKHAGEPPFSRYKKVRKRIKAQIGGERPYPEMPSEIHGELTDSLQKCLHHDPHKRPCMRQMMHVLGFLAANRLQFELLSCRCVVCHHAENMIACELVSTWTDGLQIHQQVRLVAFSCAVQTATSGPGEQLGSGRRCSRPCFLKQHHLGRAACGRGGSNHRHGGGASARHQP
jgi:hypothetical protein